MNIGPEKNKARQIGFYLLIALLLAATVYTMTRTPSAEKLSYSEVVELFETKQVKSFAIDTDGNLTMELWEPYKGNSAYSYRVGAFSIFYNDLNDLIREQTADGTLTQYDYPPAQEMAWWVAFVPYLFIFLMMGAMWFAMMRSAQGGGAGGVMKFSKARTRLGSEEKKKKTFADVAGADEEKEELEEIVEYLKNPKAYSEMGARIPKGVLLVGPPGTGKTLLAKAVAGEAGVEFLSISGSDFVELYVGVGAGRVRDLFEQAKKVAPAIVFIDEIDAVGRQRGSGLGGGHDEREQTLNQLLVEMDGFNDNDGVIVMAATNRADILDNALLRPGRFDRRVYVGLPDIKGREEILKVHARGKRLGDDVDLKEIAKGTPGFTGADLENLLNEAALLAVRRKRRFIRQVDIDDAILKVAMGPEKKSRVITEKERRLTAYHEAGHAVTAHWLEHVDPVQYITIIPRGQAGGFTLMRQQDDKSYRSRSEMFEDIVMSLGGRTAERLFLDDISTGASGDIQQATNVARNMVTVYGMSDRLGPISFDSSGHSIFIGRDFGQTKSYSEETAAIIDEEIKRIFDEATALCESILREHADVLRGVAEYLLINETMDGADFNYYCEHGELPPAKEEPALPEETGEDGPALPEADTDEGEEPEEAEGAEPEEPDEAAPGQSEDGCEEE